jgi:hypothetical protein
VVHGHQTSDLVGSLDAATCARASLLKVDGDPGTVGAGLGSVWVANDRAGTILRLVPEEVSARGARNPPRHHPAPMSCSDFPACGAPAFEAKVPARYRRVQKRAARCGTLPSPFRGAA